MSTAVRLPDNWREIRQAARDVRLQAYAPYSGYQVGAAVRMADGRIFAGCNVENASWGLTVCAERVAMCSAVSAGARLPEVICVSLTDHPSPCGSCRQFLFEFNPSLTVLLDNCDSDDPPECLELQELLPRGFRLDRNR